MPSMLFTSFVHDAIVAVLVVFVVAVVVTVVLVIERRFRIASIMYTEDNSLVEGTLHSESYQTYSLAEYDHGSPLLLID